MKVDVDKLFDDLVTIKCSHGTSVDCILTDKKLEDVAILDICCAQKMENLAANENVKLYVDHHSNYSCNYDLSGKDRIVLIESKPSCVQLIKDNYDMILKAAPKLKHIIFNFDVDSVLSLIVVALARKGIRIDLDRLAEVANKCDTADYIGDEDAELLHKSLFVKRGYAIIKLFTTFVVSGMSKKTKTAQELQRLASIYRNTVVLPFTWALAKVERIGKIAVLKESVTDFTYASNRLYDMGYDFVVSRRLNTCYIATKRKDVHLNDYLKIYPGDYNTSFKIAISADLMPEVIEKLKRLEDK